jgi:hypothetical protein
MWPWEHLAFGYLWLSLGTHVWGDRRPSDEAVVALAVGTQFPDLVDKPLAWWLGVLPSGVSLGHSILIALPAVGLLVWITKRRGQGAVGWAFGVGYLSHIAADGVFSLAIDGDISPGYMLWPLLSRPGKDTTFFVTVGELWATFVRFLGSPRGRLYLGVELLFLAGVLVLWVSDGTPGVRWLRGGGSGGSVRSGGESDGPDWWRQ